MLTKQRYTHSTTL